ncbi:hypothetical protein [Halolamina pelagica]|nr:hypothetical protein [Halolamina pelagica]
MAGLGSLTAGSVLAVGSGAFTSVSARRTVSVQTAADYESLLGLTQIGAGERSELDGTPSQLEFTLPGDDEDEYPSQDPTNPQGLGTDSVYRFGQDAGAETSGLFAVENLGTQPVQVYSTQSDTSGVPEVTMYNVETGNLLTKNSPSATLPTANRLLCGLEVDTHGVPVRETEYDVTLTITAVAAGD